MLTNQVISYIRTFVPMLVGLLVAWLQPLGIDVDTEAAIAFLTTLVSGVYYLVARLLEKRWPKLGWLLGAPKQPVYETPPVPENPRP